MGTFHVSVILPDSANLIIMNHDGGPIYSTHLSYTERDGYKLANIWDYPIEHIAPNFYNATKNDITLSIMDTWTGSMQDNDYSDLLDMAMNSGFESPDAFDVLVDTEGKSHLKNKFKVNKEYPTDRFRTIYKNLWEDIKKFVVEEGKPHFEAKMQGILPKKM